MKKTKKAQAGTRMAAQKAEFLRKNDSVQKALQQKKAIDTTNIKKKK